MSTTPDNSSNIRSQRKVGDEEYHVDDAKKVTPSKPAPQGFKQLMGEEEDRTTKKDHAKKTPRHRRAEPEQQQHTNLVREKRPTTPMNVARKDDDDEEDVTGLITLLSRGTKAKPEIKSKDDTDENSQFGEDGYYDAIVKKTTNTSKKDISFGDHNTPQENPWDVFVPKENPSQQRQIAEDAIAKESPFNLYTKGLSSKESSKTEKKERIASRYQDDQPDLSYVNPLQSQSLIASIGESKQQVTPYISATIKAIVDQIVKQLYIVEKAGQTDTVVILKQPPLFQDAQIVLTSFDSATKEFNLSFENLNAQAKQILDENMHSLRTTLELQGYANAVHIVTTTTMVEHHFPGQDQGSKEERYAGDQGKGKQQDQDNEEELT